MFYEICIILYVLFSRIANSLPCFTSLVQADQVALLKENADLIVSLRGAIFFDKKKKGMDQILSSIGISTYVIVLQKCIFFRYVFLFLDK